jgi:hypothetical protein
MHLLWRFSDGQDCPDLIDRMAYPDAPREAHEDQPIDRMTLSISVRVRHLW